MKRSNSLPAPASHQGKITLRRLQQITPLSLRLNPRPLFGANLTLEPIMTNTEQQREALSRAQGGFSFSNYPIIIAGFVEKGIPAADIRPRENVFTYNAWLALGRQVRKGEHGIKVLTFITCQPKNKATDASATDPQQKKHGYRRPWSTTVFHVSQTDPIASA